MENTPSIKLPLDSITLAEIRRIAGHLGKIYLFGSRATGRNKPFSDIDLCVVSDSPIPDEVMGSLKESFQESNIPFKVDIVDYHQISNEFRAMISKDWIEIQ